MQIHEITQRKLDEGVGSFLGGLAGGIANVAGDVVGAISPAGDAKSAYASAVRPQQIKMLSDKAYTGWKQYEKTLLQSNPDARETGMYEQALLAFVTKNLLGGQYLPNVINKNQIVALVKQLSQSGETAKTPPGGTEGMQSDLEEVSMGLPLGNVDQYKGTANGVKSAPNPTSTAGDSLSPGQIPGKADLLKGKQATQPGKTAAPATKSAPSTAMSAQQEKDLWLKLTQQAVVATTQAPGAGATKNTNTDPGDNDIGDARTIKTELENNQQIKSFAQSLGIFGSESSRRMGTNSVKTTNNPVADALLLMAGFRGI